MKSMRRAPSSMARRAFFLAQGGVGGQGGFDELDGLLGVEARGGNVGAHLVGCGDSGGAPGIEPEGVVADIDEIFGGDDFGHGLVDATGGVAVEDGAEGGLVGRGVRLAGLPGGCGAEENAEPVLVVEAFAIVVPDCHELAGAAEALAGGDEARDVVEGGAFDGEDLTPVGVAGSDPGFEALLLEGQDVVVVAVFVPVDPGDGDHVLGDAGDGGGVGVADVAPEDEAAMEGCEGGVDGVEEVAVDGAEAALIDVGLGAAGAEVEGFVGADVEEGAGEVGGDLGEPALDEREGSGLAGGDDVAVRRSRLRWRIFRTRACGGRGRRLPARARS